MKKFIFCLLTAGSIFSLYAGEFNLVRHGKAESFLETNPHPSPHEKLAVKELSTYINRISGASISTGAEKSKNRIVLADLEKNRTTLPAAVVSRLEKHQAGKPIIFTGMAIPYILQAELLPEHFTAHTLS